MKKLFILDTNVLISDPNAIFKFDDNDIYISFIVLEELDGLKKGVSEASRNAREATRKLEDITSKDRVPCAKGQVYSLGKGKGNLIFEQSDEEQLLKQTKTIPHDNLIIHSALKPYVLSTLEDYISVSLVSRDINVRIKCRALNIKCEDYKTEQVLRDDEILPTGLINLNDISVDNSHKIINSFFNNNESTHSIQIKINPNVSNAVINLYVIIDDESQTSSLWVVSSISNDIVTINKVIGQKAWGQTPRNNEQLAAMNAIMNPDIHFVSLLGQAGTGKTFIALACALELVMELNHYQEIIVTRATVSVGDEIGFLPGSEEEKLTPWLGSVFDNIEALSPGEFATEEIMKKIKIKSISFMRGRSIAKRLFIIDEAQNLTHHQIKMLLTRSGEGTKVICLGNLSQIDTPYLTESNSGLSYAVKSIYPWERSAHLILQEGVRSELAEYCEIHL